MGLVVPDIRLIAVHIGKKVPVARTSQRSLDFSAQIQGLGYLPLRQQSGVHHHIPVFLMDEGLMTHPIQ